MCPCLCFFVHYWCVFWALGIFFKIQHGLQAFKIQHGLQAFFEGASKWHPMAKHKKMALKNACKKTHEINGIFLQA